MIPDTLRHHIRSLERASNRAGGVLPFGIAAIDRHLPEGGLRRGTLHEVAGGGADDIHAAAATLFLAGLVARMDGPALWTGTSADLFVPGLACAGLDPGRLLLVRAADEAAVLLVMEEALRHAGLCAVVGELTRLPMVASRRLVLAAERSGVTALALRRRAEGRPAEAGLTAAATRWRITPLPAAPAIVPRAMGRARWRVALTRSRGAEAADWTMEACDAQGRLSLSAELAAGSAAQGRRAAA